jgi:A/G-specific adenine glycosylase
VVPATLTDRSAALLAWSERTRRPLPWRATRDPWAVLVSEVMLQQTQVDRVVPRWAAFLTRFPTVASCAEAPVGDVVRLWAGLGYNRRAINLHRCAVAVVADHGGTVPDDLGALQRLPGVGPYTARAILAFAFERDVGVLDTNVGRVLARWRGAPMARPEAQRLADAVVPAGSGWAWNQALMDLGASVCARRRPRCAACPVQVTCSWAAAGQPAPDPADGSAGVSGGQSRFAGSDREGRGQLVDALRHGPVSVADLAAVMGWADDPDRAARVATGVIADGLALDDGEHLRLP